MHVESDTQPTVGSQQFFHNHASGAIEFDPYNPFYDPMIPGRVNRTLLEKIIVIYKTV